MPVMIISSSKVYVISTIIIMVLVGSNYSGINEGIKSVFKSSDSTPMIFAHGSLKIPEFNEGNLECFNGKPFPESLLVPPPDQFYLQDYERSLYNFILRRDYADLGWCVDFKIRDTGPWIKGNYYGIHPAVRIYYSPRMMYWLTGNASYWPEGNVKDKAPRSGEVPEGAIIIKEMFTPPADLYAQIDSLFSNSTDPKCKTEDAYEELILELMSAWAIMVKTKDHSKDDWLWVSASPANKGESIEAAIERQLDDYDHILNTGFGLYCMRCHASAEKEYTYSDLHNITGDNALEFRNDNSWRNKGHLIGKDSVNSPLAKILGNACMNDDEVRQLLILPQELLPWKDDNIKAWKVYMDRHMPAVDPTYDEEQGAMRKKPNEEFLETFPQIKAVNPKSVKTFPMQWADHVVPGADGPEQYITSDNCLGCHGGLGGDPYDIAMFVKTGPNYGDGYNVSEYGEWRWSPMGLAGRDPIFYAQLESEMAYLEQDEKRGGLLKGSLKTNQEQVTNTCASCHGSMGQRQLLIDSKKDASLDPNFKIDYVYLTEALTEKDTNQPNYEYHKYGELAREGISCATCHHIAAPDKDSIRLWNPDPNWVLGADNKSTAYYLFHNTTGQYNYGPADELYGPLDEVKTYPMENQMGITPVGSEFIQDSKMCGSCHSINLPNIGLEEAEYPVLNAAEQNPALKPYNHTIEQATFLEWQNSDFASDDKDLFRSCQDCHMPKGFESLDGTIKIDQLTTKIATIQDNTYPAVLGLAGPDSIGVTLRDDYKRHEHVGLNVFLLEMFDQFPDILGVAKSDYMTGDTMGNAFAIENMIKQARSETIDLDVEIIGETQDSIDVLVSLSNLTGHRFPSGVAFRRAFIELVVNDGNRTIWGSGRTNGVGVIVDGNGDPLKTEFLPNANAYQRHHQIIRSQNQVQIYEELNQDAERNFTTSFVHRVHDIKDNRLLPSGYQPASTFKDRGEVIYEFMRATDPLFESVEGDTCYSKPMGKKYYGRDQIIYRIPAQNKDKNRRSIEIKATVYSQAIPPYWLHQRFEAAPDSLATRRLYYLASNLNLDNTIMKDWKLPLVSKSVTLNRKRMKRR